ncbi:MAG: hypothetical protein EBS17_03770 [Flavobacteriia bacterium]|nr:hypothetical protein [Flavobacteriia bacterium]
MKLNFDSFYRYLIVFIASIIWIISYLIPKINHQSFQDRYIEDWLEEFDTSRVELSKEEDGDKEPKKDDAEPKKLRYFHWKWEDYSGTRCEVKFSIPEEDYFKAKTYRENYRNASLSLLYQDFVQVCSRPISLLAEAFRKEMDQRKLQGIERLNFLVTAIQTPPYTYIEIDECDDGICAPDGCCPFVQPFAVYTPTEYIFQETGDCDTKSLLAFALLKKLNYHAALLVGDTDAGPHAMLGVAHQNPAIPSRTVRYNGTIYYPWETTNFEEEFQLGNMRMWRGWNHWTVMLN